MGEGKGTRGKRSERDYFFSCFSLLLKQGSHWGDVLLGTHGRSFDGCSNKAKLSCAEARTVTLWQRVWGCRSQVWPLPYGWFPGECSALSGRGEEKQGKPFPSAVWWFDIASILNLVFAIADVPISMSSQQQRLKIRVFHPKPSRRGGKGVGSSWRCAGRAAVVPNSVSQHVFPYLVDISQANLCSWGQLRWAGEPC